MILYVLNKEIFPYLSHPVFASLYRLANYMVADSLICIMIISAYILITGKSNVIEFKTYAFIGLHDDIFSCTRDYFSFSPHHNFVYSRVWDILEIETKQANDICQKR